MPNHQEPFSRNQKPGTNPNSASIQEQTKKVVSSFVATSTQAKDKLSQAYDQMLVRVKETYQQVSQEGQPYIMSTLAKAKEKAIQLGELTEAEAEQVAQSLQRDLADAAVFVKDAKKLLSDWLYFDYKLVEGSCWDNFKAVVNQVKREWAEMSQRSAASDYKKGQVTGAGSLECTQCHHVLHFSGTTTIPECPSCHHSSFKRKSS